uniref:RNA-directed DNA polymerase, eukaryota, reverse transcriptase zinc-binding domain protein n=1 Tax=Tanacetum cinerariifolium TaxID=118510 RepID=A0A6L2MH50_TANCI|nr:RNA-directed DNA polymerase, eukaryota, reverse transcriptase zinc-binding domain protein [Tanacetum cinerariifolium]
MDKNNMHICHDLKSKPFHTKLKDLNSHLKLWYAYTKEVEANRTICILATLRDLDKKIDDDHATDVDMTTRINSMQELEDLDKMESMDLLGNLELNGRMRYLGFIHDIWLNNTAFTPVIVQSVFLVLKLAERREGERVNQKTRDEEKRRSNCATRSLPPGWELDMIAAQHKVLPPG